FPLLSSLPLSLFFPSLFSFFSLFFPLFFSSFPLSFPSSLPFFFFPSPFLLLFSLLSLPPFPLSFPLSSSLPPLFLLFFPLLFFFSFF
ncbi:hypothetical protein ACXWR7_10895, partial [Streptococcus pyogenes]